MPILERLESSGAALKKIGVKQATSVDDIRQAQKNGEMRVIFNAQGSDWAIDDILMLDQAAAAGLRVAGFTYNNDNAFAGGGTKQSSGLTEEGKRFVKHANELGVVLDCSHTSNQTCLDLASASTKPVIASHSNPLKLMKHNRNVTDEVIKAIASTGGAICLVGAGLYMNEELDSSPERLLKHVNYVAELVGHDKTCYSTDYMHNAEQFFKKSIDDVKVFPPEKGFGAPAQNIATEHVWDVVAGLEEEYGWTEEQIRGFLGENLLRVYEANWK